MDTKDIERFLEKATTEQPYVKIRFKKRADMYGLFIIDKDYAELKSKNFWRIVPQSQLNAYNESKNNNLARIFCGLEFTRLTLYSDSFEE